MESKKLELFNKLSFITFLSTLFIFLFFFIPYIPVTLSAAKGFVLSIGVTLSLFFWLISRFIDGKFVIPQDRLMLFGAIIPFVFLVSSFFSSSLHLSLFGNAFELGTFGSILIFYLVFFLSAIYFQTEKRLWSFLKFLFLGAIILAVFELIHVFVGFDRFLPGLLKGISSGNLIGSWNDFALFFGLIAILSIYAIEFLKTKNRIVLISQYFLLVASLFFIMIVNMSLVWILLGIFSIIIFVYSVSTQYVGVKADDSHHVKKFPLTALIFVFICFFFLIDSNGLGGLISKNISISNIDVRPSMSATSQIALHAIKHNPFFGTSPNTFLNDWSLWQPKEIAQTPYWNVDFTNGFSSLYTFLVTTGILGFLALLFFIIVFFIRGVQSLRIALSDSFSSNNILFMTFIMATYSWIIFIVYNADIVMITLAFAGSGILIGTLVHKNVIKVREYSFLNDPRNSFFAILGLTILIIGSLSLTYVYIKKFTSIVYFSKSLNPENTIESLSKSERMLLTSITLNSNDAYYRSLSQVYMNEIGIILNDKNMSQDTLKANLQKLLDATQNQAIMAVKQNSNLYINYTNLGDIYASLVPLSVANSYESAVSAYSSAQALAPYNPSIYLSRAQLEVAHKNNDEAKKNINSALLLKPDYTNALFLLAQIQVGEGNLSDAIKTAEHASMVAPNDPTVFFRLGLLRYGNADYSGAVSAFEQAVLLDNSYWNARYSLALAYQKAGRNSDALIQYNILNKYIPDNQDVKDAIKSISQSQNTIPTTTSGSVKKPTASKTIKSNKVR